MYLQRKSTFSFPDSYYSPHHSSGGSGASLINPSVVAMMTTKLRRPNFNFTPFAPSASSSSSDNAATSSSSRVVAAATIGGGGNATTTASTARDPPPSASSRQLADCYARLRHERILLRIHDARYDDDDDDPVPANDAAVVGDDPRRGGRGGEEDDAGPIMERCVALLEPILGVFVSNCIARDEERANKRRRSSKEEGRRRGPPDESDNDGEEESDGEEVDEVPPQLTRVARFFPHRFSPMRRALLRPPPPPPPPPVRATASASMWNWPHATASAWRGRAARGVCWPTPSTSRFARPSNRIGGLRAMPVGGFRHLHAVDKSLLEV